MTGYKEFFSQKKHIPFFLFALFFLSTLPLEARQKRSLSEYIPITGATVSEVNAFKNIPMADEIGLVTNAFILPIPGIKNVYNPSMIKTSSGYTIAFRHDLPWVRVSFKKARFGLIQVDGQFHPTGNFRFLNTRDDQVEDPKLFIHDNACYVSYIHLSFWGRDYLCNIGMSGVDLNSQSVTHSWELLYKKGPKEKNWTPLSYRNEEGISELYFVYEYNPVKVIRMKQTFTGAIEHPFPQTQSTLLEDWEKQWGKIRGGTPALRLDSGEYITFFHSSFREKSLLWYVVGALTFEGKPPFAIKSISQWPILFKDMYTTPIAQGKNRVLRALFPGGLAPDTIRGKEVFHVICGENDTSIKVVTIDKEALLKHMKHSTK